MKNNGLTIFGDTPEWPRRRPVGPRLGASICLSALLLTGACATDSEVAPPPAQTQAQRDLDTNTAQLSQPLVAEETVQEGTLLGGLLGGAIAFGVGKQSGNAPVAVPVGMLAGSAAGRYVAAKQAEYSEKAAVIEAITRDVRSKNQEAGRTVKAMEVVVADHREQLAQLRAAKDKGRRNELQLQQQVTTAKRDLETMMQATGKAKEHLALFGEARGIVVTEKTPIPAAEDPAVKSMDGEIELLRKRIQSMNSLVNELSSVS
jgi:outer membrane lipoprotein SlyB